MTDFKDERSEPQSGWAAKGKRIRPNAVVIVLPLLITFYASVELLRSYMDLCRLTVIILACHALDLLNTSNTGDL